VEHRRITSRLRERIQAGQWPVGTMIPGRRELAREFNVSAATLERAIVPLLSDGTLRADSRRGTFVAGAHPVTMQPAPAEEPVAGGGECHPVLMPARPGAVGVIASLYSDPGKPDSQHNFWMRLIVDSIERSLADSRRATTFQNRVVSPGGLSLPLGEALEITARQQLAGIIVICFDMEPDAAAEAVAGFDSWEIPVVSVLAGETVRPIPHVYYDNVGAGYQAADYLIRLGYTSLTMIAPFRAGWVDERLDGVRRAMRHAALPDSALTVHEGDHGPWRLVEDPAPATLRSLYKAFAEGWTPEGGIICASDSVAFTLLGLLADRLDTPDYDFAVVGFDDNPNSRMGGLTSLRPPMSAIGYEAARLILGQIDGQRNATQVRLRAHLIPRPSACDDPDAPAMRKAWRTEQANWRSLL
jgi:DNA-binding LacI/PurR family transcriptional regulator